MAGKSQHYKKYTARIWFYPVLLPFVLFLFFGCNRTSDIGKENILAEVGAKKIDKKEFMEKFRKIKARTGFQDNGAIRRGILKNLISDNLLVMEALKEGLGDDREARFEYNRIKTQEILNLFNNKIIASRVKVEENELKQLYVRLNTRLKARHLYAPTRKKADSLYALLQAGVPFEEIARKNFKDPVLKASGGSLGYFTVDEMDPGFEEAAYSLKIGEISHPVKTATGYSIIRVEDRRTKPLLTETDYAKYRSKLKSYWRRRKILKATQDFVDSLRQQLNISYNETTLSKLFALLKNKNSDKISLKVLENNYGDGSLRDAELLRYRGGKWKVSDFQKKSELTSPKEQNWIRSKETFREFINGLVVREWILAEAKKYKLEKSAVYKENVQNEWDGFLQERMETKIFEGIVVPEDSALAYYNSDPMRFAIPPKIHLREIVLSRQKDANTVSALLKKGVSFSRLANRYSVRQSKIGSGGDLGFLTPQELGGLSKVALSLKAGEWKGPVKIDGMYTFLKCEEKIPERKRNFRDARQDVTQTLKRMWFERTRKKKLEKFAEKIPVKSYPERLIKLLMN